VRMWSVVSQLVFVYSGTTVSAQDKENLSKLWNRSKFHSFNSAVGKSTNAVAAPGISIAMDSRLENGIEMSAELRLRVHIILPDIFT